MSISASQWGSPVASRRALLIHGLTASSHSWEDVAQLLAADGFFVIAPNLLGHGLRRGSDYRMSVLAEDLQPYFAMDTSYDVIIGHSLGGTVVLALLPFLPKEKETTVILVDPPLETPYEKLKIDKDLVLDQVTNIKTADEFMAENPAWSRADCVLRALAVSICDRTIVSLLQHNTPWSFSGLFKDIPPNVKVTVLVADPKLSDICRLEQIPRDIERLNVGHRIQPECLGAIWPIMDVIPQPRVEL